ncbi:GNAT family N-acetyltransferase [Halalkalibacter urbisdiaboli]|uniref:GNAT family N-acetyltransferase n=1 Tax=Halalkalibacter urbisdiaboli TaxID=1960589 RepID=UPI000B440088|nr:GNAT family protein [Halalkalibacter urbisdiaboli]
MFTDDIVLDGKRVRLVPMSNEHSEELFKASNHSEIWTYSPGNINKPEDMLNTINDLLELKKQGLWYPFVILDKNTNKIVGSTSYLEISPQHRKLEIGGTWLDPKVWRTRVNTECKYLLLRYGFEVLELVRIQLRTDSRNERSNRAIQRIGAKFEGTLRQELINHDGYIRDSNIYSILDKEWEAVKRNLVSFLSR